METHTDHSGQKTVSASSDDGAGPGAGTRGQSMEYEPYPKIDPADVHPPPPPPSNSSPKSVSWSSDLVREAPPPPPTAWNAVEHEATSMPAEGNPYVTPAPVSSKNTMESVKEVLGKWGKKLGETAKKTEDLAGNFWQHCELRDLDEFLLRKLLFIFLSIYFTRFILHYKDMNSIFLMYSWAVNSNIS